MFFPLTRIMKYADMGEEFGYAIPMQAEIYEHLN